jgi:hypothetical protein
MQNKNFSFSFLADNSNKNIVADCENHNNKEAITVLQMQREYMNQKGRNTKNTSIATNKYNNALIKNIQLSV